jgi:hypothetical protein
MFSHFLATAEYCAIEDNKHRGLVVLYTIAIARSANDSGTQSMRCAFPTL